MLQNVNVHLHTDDVVWMEAYHERKRKAIEHVICCIYLYKLQAQSGRYFFAWAPTGGNIMGSGDGQRN